MSIFQVKANVIGGINRNEMYPNQNLEISKTVSFGDLLKNMIEEANTLQQRADRLTESFLMGEPVEIHQVVLAMEKADIALRQTMQIRNKMLEAYKEIANMQI
ncbi:MAG: flagellar hook-basal body complex protein FliE [Syntrophomonadaceae bacterium]|jgi:flagellar hook-basal body complex protein FliE